MLERLPDTAQRRIIEQLDALELAPGAERERAAQLLAASRFIAAWAPVSYTHLTLPTIYSV